MKKESVSSDIFGGAPCDRDLKEVNNNLVNDFWFLHDDTFSFWLLTMTIWQQVLNPRGKSEVFYSTDLLTVATVYTLTVFHHDSAFFVNLGLERQINMAAY